MAVDCASKGETHHVDCKIALEIMKLADELKVEDGEVQSERGQRSTNGQVSRQNTYGIGVAYLVTRNM